MSAEVIKILFDRIKYLEQEIASLQQHTGLDLPDEKQPLFLVSDSSTVLNDRLIEDFLDGAGI